MIRVEMPVFISHDMDDQSEYRQLVDGLNAAGIAHWDPKSMRSGASLAQQLVEGLNACDTCVFLATKNSVESAWCFAETGAFWGAGKKLVAFLADATIGTSTLPPQIRGDLAATTIADLLKVVKNEALRDAADLTLKGSVLAIGTWDFRAGQVLNDNERFLQNVWNGLKG